MPCANLSLTIKTEVVYTAAFDSYRYVCYTTSYRSGIVMKIKFVSNGLNQDGSLTGSRHRAVTVNMAYYFLKHYYYLHGQGKPTWLDCDLVHVEDFSDQFTKIKS